MSLTPAGVVFERAGWCPNPKGSPDAKRGSIKGLSRKSAKRLRRFLIEMHVPLTPDGRVMALTYTVPHTVSEDEWRTALRRWSKKLERAGVAVVWRVELQKRKQPHIHVLAYLPHGSAAEFVAVGVGSWLECLPKRCQDHPHARRRALKEKVLTTGSDPAPVHQWLAYLAAHHTKAKREQLGWQGRQWGVINGKLFVPYFTTTLSLYDSEFPKLNRLMRRYLRNYVERRNWRFLKHGNHGWSRVMDPGAVKLMCRWLLRERNRMDDRGERGRYMTRPPLRYALRK